MPTLNRFQLRGQIVVITGGTGLLGIQHAEAIAEMDGVPILFDVDECAAEEKIKQLKTSFSTECLYFKGDVTDEESVRNLSRKLLTKFGRIDVLINNAAIDAKIGNESDDSLTRLENLSLERWNDELAVGLTGAFICSKVIGSTMANQGKGVILNVSSDLGLIAPNQKLYHKSGLLDDQQPVKPMTYSVVKHGLIGLTRYLATYWAHQGVRANVLCPGSVSAGQPEEFVHKLTELIPAGRLAQPYEYKAAVQFLCSDASSYMNGACVVMDGGRTAW